MATAQISTPLVKPSAPPPDDPKDQLLPGEHTLPASWWTSEKIFDLEKRAIFHKSWILCTHTSRFDKGGDFFTFKFTGIQFFIIKSKSGTFQAFHNVCRHRAYPVLTKESGNSKIAACRYHGWSYNIGDGSGKLKGAPKFEKVEGFNKDENSLFPIKTHVTEQGLIFVNFSNDDVVPFDEWYKGLNGELNEFDFSDYEYHMSYSLDGKFNWKTLMDGYQECYHCPTAHPGLSKAFKMETYKVSPRGRYCRHYATIVKEEPDQKEAEMEEEQEEQEGSGWFGFGKKDAKKEAAKSAAKTTAKKNVGGDFNGLWLYLFPVRGVNCYSPAWYFMRILPISAKHTIIEYDIYTKKGLDEVSKKEFVDFLQEVELEDFNLCEYTQENLNQGVYSSGYLHPTKENGVLFYQGLVRDMVKEHFGLEQELGRPVYPAFVGKKSDNEETQELDEMCNQLECGGGTAIEW